MPELLPIILLILLLAWANGANDVAKGVATLAGSGVSNARHAILWGVFWTVLGGLATLLWGRELMAAFGGGWLAPGFRITPAFLAAALLATGSWILFATRLGLPVSTTHALLGGTVGGALAAIGPDALQLGTVTHQALLPLLLSPLIAIALCWGLLLLGGYVARRVPSWRPGCCAEETWRRNPFVCAEPSLRPPPWQQKIWVGLHWLSGAATSFARGLNDTPKIAAFLILAAGLAPETTRLSAEYGSTWPVVAIALVMGAGGLWGGMRILKVLAHRVVPLDAATGLTANVGTSFLVLAATPLGLPVSTTHVSTGALMGVRWAAKKKPDRADALKPILLGWIVTLPVTALMATAIGWMTR